MKRSGRLLLSLGLIVMGGASKAHALTTTNFDIVAKNAACLPNATGHVTVLHREETEGVDTLHLNVSGLPADTDFTVFLTSADAFATPPFGTSLHPMASAAKSSDRRRRRLALTRPLLFCGPRPP